MTRLAAAVAVVLACAGAARAGEVSLGLGYDDVLGSDGGGAGSLGLQVQTDPLAELGAFDFGFGAAIEADTDGDVWGGAGPTVALPLRGGFRIDGSLMAGGYAKGDGGDDLGSGLEFRTRIGLSRALRGPWRIGLAIEHKSNGGIGDINPGVETLFVTLSRRF
jgi:hypothetical protein